MPRYVAVLISLACAAAAAVLTGLMVGSLNLSPQRVLFALAGQGDQLAGQIVWSVRLPRALAAFAVGGLLAVAGALMQVMLRNPLADPYVLGVSGGASVAALLGLMAGMGTAQIALPAFLGALGSIALVFGLARQGSGWNPARLLLSGVGLAAGWWALIRFLLAVADPFHLPGMLFWLMGDLGAVVRTPWWALAVLAILAGLALPLGRSLNVLARGSLQARSMGVPVGRLQPAIHIVAALATASAVTVAGSVGFVGLVIPHLLRLAIGNDQRLLIPAAALAGGGFLVLADTLARTILAPQQLPVGVVTAFLGVPMFLYLLNRRIAR
ncbi:FecCD family ABC transporter permease [Candidatus Macondimonas diazotrophica]|jgi:iron complex transport system permease protein|uniref:Iron ABC transporter permease n=1 Tax=Candidatus Macondimonas diazotrophica TaxID=2305248 RepID=A0A4Z0F9U7_9GAMM|nr:iron ABC transporter permease [Candidatus Macondimonas diazotrophica]NCU00972.1 iron ABC transporter permease [Candidatus Macondimonas diazotrophica]TFZ83209.1 iron ABC transporter permease [Candidatus Macondimonas diazotrophica]HBG29606.1 ABC transporter permease [Gammaproteobacteria bacterium]